MIDTATFQPHASVPLAQILRAQVAASRVAMPVDGAGYARLTNITAVPAIGGYGYPMSNLRAIDTLITRMRSDGTDGGAIETLQQRIALAAERIERDIVDRRESSPFARGFFVDIEH